MVSNRLELDAEELTAEVLRVAEEFRDDPEYQALRREFPDDWPL